MKKYRVVQCGTLSVQIHLDQADPAETLDQMVYISGDMVCMVFVRDVPDVADVLLLEEATLTPQERVN
jgi:hypothetical protein